MTIVCDGKLHCLTMWSDLFSLSLIMTRKSIRLDITYSQWLDNQYNTKRWEVQEITRTRPVQDNDKEEFHLKTHFNSTEDVSTLQSSQRNDCEPMKPSFSQVLTIARGNPNSKDCTHIRRGRTFVRKGWLLPERGKRPERTPWWFIC